MISCAAWMKVSANSGSNGHTCARTWVWNAWSWLIAAVGLLRSIAARAAESVAI